MFIGLPGIVTRILSRFLISLLLSSPFFIAGGLSHLDPSVPMPLTIVVLCVGAAIILLGTYMSLSGVAPTPTLATGERTLVSRHPSQLPAYSRIIISLPFIIGTGYMFTFTEVPYVYPFATFVIGMYFFFKGMMKYMRNLHITYTITDRRVMHMYKFLWLQTKEIPVTRIISISEARSFFEIITGRGTVVVSAGIGSGQTVRIEEIDNVTPVAETLREMLPQGGAA